ncbi:hypothetical protein NMD1_03903 [Novosphingobium sp. MD-1]|nr:hypothetical protein NMD1_03903 [Novosphingobium sp. MD-1]
MRYENQTNHETGWLRKTAEHLILPMLNAGFAGSRDTRNRWQFHCTSSRATSPSLSPVVFEQVSRP